MLCSLINLPVPEFNFYCCPTAVIQSYYHIALKSRFVTIMENFSIIRLCVNILKL